MPPDEHPAKPNDPSAARAGGPRRRDVLAGAAALTGLALTGLSGCRSAVPTGGAGALPRASATRRPDAVRTENARPGTRDWRLTRTRLDPAQRWRSPAIEGYASATSVRAGDTLDVMVSTRPASAFTLDLYRMGYYGGDGGRHVLSLGPLAGRPRPDPTAGPDGLLACAWEPAASIEIPDDWLSGVYLGKLTAEQEGLQSYVVFVVRDDRPVDHLVQVSDLTWCAYNRWPDRGSLYDRDGDPWYVGPNGPVGFERPYGAWCQPDIVDAPLTVGAGEFLLWEFPLAFWLERHGHDVSYLSNVDTHRDGPGLLRARSFLSVGHDEYWSQAMFDNVRAARDAGLNLAFLSGNAVWNVAPLLPGRDGRPARALRRDGQYLPPDPGDALQAELGFPLRGPDAARLMGARSAAPWTGGGDWVCRAPDHWLFAGTQMAAGDAIEGLVGWEFHGAPARDLPGFTLLASAPVRNDRRERGRFTATLYDGPRDNLVFNAGTIWWPQALALPPGHVLPAAHGARPRGPDPRAQTLTANLLARFAQG